MVASCQRIPFPSSSMALLRRNRRTLAVVGIVIFTLTCLYLANVHFLNKASITESPPLNRQFPIHVSGAVAGKATGDQCVNIHQPSVDIQTEQLWFDLFGRGNSSPPGLDVWWTNEFNDSEVDNELKLKVFVLPHSHVDPGWLKTVGEYTNATNNMLYNMLTYMPEHPNMTFTWMEMDFFETWWRGLTGTEKTLTKKLINEGRFQITSGSQVMTDEASPYFWASIDNIVEGHQFLKRELDITPSVIWSNDPFGYGATVPYLFHLANISRLVIQRVNSAVKTNLGQRKAMDFYFRQFFDAAGRFDTQVHVLPFVHYDVPHTCGPDAEVCCSFDFKRITNWGCSGGFAEPITRANIAKKAQQLKDQYWLLSRMYRNNVVLVMLGDDFRYDDITEWSQQHDNYMQLMEYMDRRPEWNIEVRFGTFNDFFSALAGRSQSDATRLNLPVISGDFYPYSDVYDHYWTGYFSTRPFYKRQDRLVQAMIRAADISSSLVYFNGLASKSSFKWGPKLRQSHRNLALFQHHDAITGTSKWKVVEDYGKKLQQALLNAASIVGEAVSILTGGEGEEMQWTQNMPYYNESLVDQLMSLKFDQKTLIWVFNTLPYWRSELVRIRISVTDCVIVTDLNGKTVRSQLNPIFNLTGVESQVEFHLLFEAKLPPLAAVYFHLLRSEAASDNCARVPKIFVGGSKTALFTFPKQFAVRPLETARNNTVTLGNEVITTYHSADTGYLQAIKRKKTAVFPSSSLWEGRLEFWRYTDTASGAYLFTPTTPAQLWPRDRITVIAVRGAVTDEIHSFTNCIYHKEYLRKFSTLPEPDVQVYIENTLDVRSQDNVELVMRIRNTHITNPENRFMTDSNGLQLMPRRYLPNQPVPMNYYPMASQLVLQSDSKRLTLLSGQPHGATVHPPGTMEVMLERRLTMDDGKGLGYDSLIRDNVPVESYFRLVLESGDFAQSRTLSLASQRSLQSLLYAPVAFVQRDSSKTLVQYSPLQESFPCDTLLLNIRPLQWPSTNSSSAGSRKHLLLLHRVLSECKSKDDKHCDGASHKDLASQLTRLLKNARAQDCTLSGVEADTPFSRNKENRLDAYVNAALPLKPMEIKSICVS